VEKFFALRWVKLTGMSGLPPIPILRS
jgi:hypothetical protein